MKCEVALDHLNDYVEARVDAPLRVVLDHHFQECASCRRELEGARDLAALFSSLPRVDSPAGFRAAVLWRVSDAQGRPAGRLHRWGRALGARRAPIAGLAAAALVLGLVFTAPSFRDSVQLGPLPVRVLLPRMFHPQPERSGAPDVLVGGGQRAPHVGGEATINVVVQPSADLNEARVILPRVSDGLALENDSVPTDRGRVVWQGSVPAGTTMRFPLTFRAVHPGVHRVLLYVEGDGHSFQRLVFIPVLSTEPPPPGSAASDDLLRGDWSTSETIERLAGRSGAVIATDLSREREEEIAVDPDHLGRAIAQIAAQRGMQWSRVDGVYNLFSGSSGPPITVSPQR